MWFSIIITTFITWSYPAYLTPSAVLDAWHALVAYHAPLPPHEPVHFLTNAAPTHINAADDMKGECCGGACGRRLAAALSRVAWRDKIRRIGEKAVRDVVAKKRC